MKDQLKSKCWSFFLLIFAVFTVQSCQYIEKKVPTEKELLEKELKQINWNTVDEYPSFSICDHIKDTEQRKHCFFENLTSAIEQKIQPEKLYIKFPELDTLKLKITVNQDASVLFDTQLPKDSLHIQNIEADSIIQSVLFNLPKINPAIKHGIPVKTQFILPVIIKTEK